MDLVRLGPAYSTSYKPDTLIEGYSSLIWTERFQTPGEFELRTPYISETMALLPEDTLISHLETGEVMMVESHEIDTNDAGDHELITKGRSLTCFCEHRWVEAPYQKKRSMRKAYTPYGAAEVLLWNSFDNPSGHDVTRGDTDPDTDAVLNDYPWNTLDKMTNVAVTHSCSISQSTRRWWLTEGILAPQLLNILIKGDLGFRTIRPSDNADAYIVSVAANLADRGDITRTFTQNINQLCFDIYDGVDRRTGPNRVAFNYIQGHIDNAQYLFAKNVFKTACEVQSSVGVSDQYRNGTEQNYTGIQRRVMGFDAGAPEIPDEPEKPADLKKNATAAQKEAHADAIDNWLDKHAAWKNKRDRIVGNFQDDAKDDALRELKKQRKIHLVSGDISPLAPYKYNVHYALGDTVKLLGDYNQSEDMIVTEYVRTENTDGDVGYPGLTLP